MTTTDTTASIVSDAADAITQMIDQAVALRDRAEAAGMYPLADNMSGILARVEATGRLVQHIAADELGEPAPPPPPPPAGAAR